MRELIRRAWYVLRQRHFEQDLAEEIEFHRAMAQRDLEAHGLDHTEAGQAAHRLVGNATLAREASRGVWIWPWLESLWQDAAYAMRNLRRQPGFTAVVVIVLATVIGLHTTLVTVIAGVVLRPWPGVHDANRVVTVYLRGPAGRAAALVAGGFPLHDYQTIAERARALSGVAAMYAEEVQVGAGDSARSTPALLVTGNLFDVLGIAVSPGRGFRPEEDRPGYAEPVAVLAYDYWQSQFGGDAAIIGTSVRVNGVPFTVIGVATRDFSSAEPAYGKKLFLSLAAASQLRPADPPIACCVDVAGRLAAGATREQARAELDLLSREFVLPDGATPRGVIVTGTEFASRPGRTDAVGPLAAASAISAGLILVWLIACANIGNLLLARAAARGHEIGIRLSLGASRRRLIRQLLTEGFVLALGGSALGIGIAYKLPFLILHVLGGATAFPFRIAVDGVVLGYALVLAGLSAAAFGLAPALFATRADVAAALNEREGLRASTFPLRGLLLGAQVAVSVVLLVSAGLLVRGAQRAGAFDPGFSVNDVTAVSFELPPGTYDDARRRAFLADLTIGVMRDAHTHSMGTVPPLFYQPFRGGRVVPRLLIRSSKGVPSAELKRIVAGIDPRVRIQTTPLSSHLEARVAESKWGPMLAAVLGAFALALATVGMFGVFAYAVRQRTREIGIRMALGAQPSAVVRLVLAGHSRAVLAGLLVGLFGAVASSIIMRSRLHGLSPFDPVAYLGVAAVLTVAGLAASYVPARRATRVDPVVALRYE